jgi:hypothetical protein
MSQTQGKKPEQPAVVRAKEAVNRPGRGIGLFAGLTVQRIQSAATSLQERTKSKVQLKTEEEKLGQPAISPAEEPAKLAQERAEKLVDAMGQRPGRFAAFVRLQVRKAAARAREEAEDVWAEAQNIRHKDRRKPQ